MKNFLPYLLLVINTIAFSQEKMVLDTTDYPKRQAFIKEFENSNLQLIQSLEKSQERKVFKMLKKKHGRI